MFRIGEFSRLTQVTIRMLRYYDETGLLKPATIDPLTGYRLYGVEQIPVLNKIVYLRDSGFYISEIAEALNHEDEEFLTDLFRKKQKGIEKAIEAEKEKLEKLRLAQKELQGSKNEMHYQISIKSIPSYLVLSIRRVIPTYYAEGELWKELAAYTQENQIQLSGHSAFSIYHDSDYKEQNVDVELCVPVNAGGRNNGDFIFRNTEPVPAMACTMVYGEFSNIAGAYRAFAQWLQQNTRYRMTGADRQIVHRGPWNETDPKKYLVEIQIPLEKDT